MSFDEFSQREIENFAQDYRMEKAKINSKDRKILNYIAHSRHRDQKGNKNPYRGIWDDELRLEINKELERIRDTYNLRVYENSDKKKSHKLICELLDDNEQLKEKNNFTFVENAIKDITILLDKCNTSSKDFDKEDFISFVQGFVINLAKIDNELEIHRNIYNSLVEKKWLHVLPGSDKIIDSLPDHETLLKERELTYRYHTEFLLYRIISKEVERKGWMPDTSHLVDKNEMLHHITEHLKKELPFNNNL